MTIWSGIGINYGAQLTYDTTQVDSDFDYFQSVGIARVRIAMAPYDSTGGGIAHGQDMVQRALTRGFYAVWGVVAGYGVGTITATRWSAYKAYVLNTLVPWAQSVGLSELQLSNEAELQVDGTTITSDVVRSDVRALASTIKSGGFTGKISYSTSILSTYRTPWISEGIGDLDLIGWNSYDVLANFNTRNGVIQSAFGNQTYISEFGSKGGGYSDFNDETAFYDDTASRIQFMQNVGIQSGYFFCYRDGGFGVPQNTFGLIETNGTVHLARNAVIGL